MQYFWKTDLYFIPIHIFWFPKFPSIKFVLHFNVQTTGSVLPSLGHYFNWLQIWPQDGTCHLQADLCYISMYRVYFKGQYNVLNISITWHHLNWLQIWSPGGATSNSCKLALITSLHHLHCLIALNTLLTLSVSIKLVSSSAGVTSVKFQQVSQSVSQFVWDRRTHRSDPRDTWVQ